MPLADEGAELVGGEVETVEVGQAVLALDLVDAELDLAESVVLVLLEVREGNLEYPALQRIVCVLETRGAVDEGLADAAETNSVNNPLRRAQAENVVAGSLTLGPGKCQEP